MINFTALIDQEKFEEYSKKIQSFSNKMQFNSSKFIGRKLDV